MAYGWRRPSHRVAWRIKLTAIISTTGATSVNKTKTRRLEPAGRCRLRTRYDPAAAVTLHTTMSISRPPMLNCGRRRRSDSALVGVSVSVMARSARNRTGFSANSWSPILSAAADSARLRVAKHILRRPTEKEHPRRGRDAEST